MTPEATWLCWQLADSGFPAGGFAHSLGLEAAQAHQPTRDPDSLADTARTILLQQARSSVPLLAWTHRTPAEFTQADRLNEVMLTNHVARQASSAQGRALIRAAMDAFPCPEHRQLDELTRAGKARGHLAPVFGVITAALNIPLPNAADLFLFQSLRGVMSAAVRLGIVGPLQAQTLTHQLSEPARRWAADAMQRPPEHATETAPLLSLLQSNQSRLYSRLFQS